MESIKNKCIYSHIKPNGEVFYIGIGNYNRPKIKTSRNILWKNIVEKNPEYEIMVLKNNLSIKEAIDLEVILISWYGRRDLKNGTLSNMTDGGDGIRNPSKEIREKHIKRCKKFLLKYDEAFDLYVNQNKTILELSILLSLEVSTVKKNLQKLGIKKDLLLRHKNLSKSFNRKVIPNASKKVIDSKTLEIYQSVAIAAKVFNIAESTLRHQLLGTYTAKTNLKFYDGNNTSS